MFDSPGRRARVTEAGDSEGAHDTLFHDEHLWRHGPIAMIVQGFFS
jgi:hypothetical protein